VLGDFGGAISKLVTYSDSFTVSPMSACLARIWDMGNVVCDAQCLWVTVAAGKPDAPHFTMRDLVNKENASKASGLT
jgi:hypothetical protein